MVKSPMRVFVEESNRIESITQTSDAEVDAHVVFINHRALDMAYVGLLRDVLAPGERLRVNVGDNVSIGNYQPPPGGPEIRDRLALLLTQINRNNWTAFEAHQRYERLHPMTDGNGRTGRAIWLWQMVAMGYAIPSIGFLHTWYYQSLQETRGKKG